MNSFPIRNNLLVLFLFAVSFCNAQNKGSIAIGDLVKADSHLVFYFDQTHVHPISFSLLDSVADFLHSNPNICIEVGNHLYTPAEYSRRPSQPRADEVKRYLVFKGVSPDRMSAVGYGGTKPLIDPALIDKEKDEEKKMQMHQKNRRTEFKVIAIDYKSPKVPSELSDIINSDLGLEKIAGDKTFYVDHYTEIHDFKIAAITPLTSSFSYCYIFNKENEILKIADFLEANNRIPYAFQILEDKDGSSYLRTNFLGGGTIETNLFVQHLKISDKVEVLNTDVIYSRSKIENNDLLDLNSFEIRSWRPEELRREENSFYDCLILIPELFYLKNGEPGYEEWIELRR